MSLRKQNLSINSKFNKKVSHEEGYYNNYNHNIDVSKLDLDAQYIQEFDLFDEKLSVINENLNINENGDINLIKFIIQRLNLISCTNFYEESQKDLLMKIAQKLFLLLEFYNHEDLRVKS